MKLRLKSSRARALNGHPWVYENEVKEILPKSFDGQAVSLESATGRFLGSGIYNSKSKIIWRGFSRWEAKWNKAYFEKAVNKAIENRADEPCRRIVWSEADALPGLIVDQFDQVLVVQTVTKGAERSLPDIIDVLKDRFPDSRILLRNDTPSRKLEGLDSYVKMEDGKDLEPFWANIRDVWYWLDLKNAQKTGFYLDQREEHFKIATMADDWRVLDAFCNQGAFAINCALAGAREVLGLDISADAIDQAKKNAEKNEATASFECANVFDWFTENRSEKFDLIILDPPSFARNRKSLSGALKGYKELHLRALKMLTPGGILATYCCSHHVDREAFLGTLTSAAEDSKKTVQLLFEANQPIDHPAVLHFPESLYLKGFIARVNI